MAERCLLHRMPFYTAFKKHWLTLFVWQSAEALKEWFFKAILINLLISNVFAPLDMVDGWLDLATDWNDDLLDFSSKTKGAPCM